MTPPPSLTLPTPPPLVLSSLTSSTIPYLVHLRFQREIDLLRYQVDELDRADVTDPDEDERLDTEESILADAVAHQLAGSTSYSALADEGGAAALVVGKEGPVRSVIVGRVDEWRVSGSSLEKGS